MRNVCLKALALALTVFGFAATAIRSEAQLVQIPIQFTNNWKYLQTGIEQGTAWRTNGFNDAAWSGPSQGLLGAEDAPAPYLIHAPFLTPLAVSSTVTTFYFRTTFTFTGGTNGIALWATNLVDDGCAIYLNGRLAGGVRIPVGNYNAATLFTGGTEGALETVALTNYLRPNVPNTIAVEVHQSGAASTDVAFGMKLVLITPQALAITNQPDSQTVSVGDSASFTVGVSGGPVIYRWFKEGTASPLPSTSNTLAFASVQTGNAGNYRVVVSNSVNAVTSAWATLTVVADTDGPQVTAAIINNGSFGPNSLNILFNEALNSSTLTNGARNTNNYRIVPVANTNISIRVTNILYSTALGALMYIDVNDANWNPDGNYFLVLNNIADTKGNHIAPYTRVGVSVPQISNLTQMIDAWHFYDSSVFDPEGFAIYNNTTNPWYGTNYDAKLREGINMGIWGTGNGILYIDPNTANQPCAGDEFFTQISFQNPPTLFRRTFNLASDVGTNGILRFRYLIDDGMILYLNGKEIHRYNMPGAIGSPWNENTKATTAFATAACVTNVSIPLENLRAGSNVLAAAVFQNGAAPESDTIFGLEMDGVFYRTASVPPDPAGAPRLTWTYNRAAKTIRFSWPTNYSGFNLVSRDGKLNPTWTQVRDQNNPYTNSIPVLSPTNSMYELRKP